MPYGAAAMVTPHAASVYQAAADAAAPGHATSWRRRHDARGRKTAREFALPSCPFGRVQLFPKYLVFGGSLSSWQSDPEAA
jgi:hypothetical protein